MFSEIRMLNLIPSNSKRKFLIHTEIRAHVETNKKVPKPPFLDVYIAMLSIDVLKVYLELG